MARSMLHAQNLKKSLWAEAVVNAAYTRNRCPSRALPSITPKEAWSGRKPCISHMRVFGCITYAMVPDELDAKGRKCLFLGYCEGTKAYRFMCVQSKKIIKCRDVEFMEDSTSVNNDLEMHPSGRNETPNVVIVDTSSKSPFVDDDEGTSDVKEYPSNQEGVHQHLQHHLKMQAQLVNKRGSPWRSVGTPWRMVEEPHPTPTRCGTC